MDLDIDESSFTGETLPSRKHTHPQSVVRNDISQLKNVAFMGTFVCSGHGKVCVCRREGEGVSEVNVGAALVLYREW